MATTITWPFPDHYWARDGYRYKRAEQYARMTTRRGSVGLRIGTTGATTFNANLDLDGAELYEFDAWVQHVLAGGGKWFMAPVLASGTLEIREVKFVAIDDPIELDGFDDYRISATFETRVGTEASAGIYLGFWSEDTLFIG